MTYGHSRRSPSIVIVQALGLTGMMHCRMSLLGMTAVLAAVLVGLGPLLAEPPPTPEQLKKREQEREFGKYSSRKFVTQDFSDR